MQRLFNHIQNRNRSLPSEISEMRSELQSVFQKKLLSAGVMQPGYFNDFYPILENYKRMGLITRYMITEEEYTDGGNFYKIPVIDVVSSQDQTSSRIFLNPL